MDSTNGISQRHHRVIARSETTKQSINLQSLLSIFAIESLKRFKSMDCHHL
ncbi:MAG: hypothetical protein K2N75_00910 [Helicobacter sp.]|uniref:hypothetical protein n=1 Tax=Helicobacter sp. TaxID=218 RepID=UPI0023CB35B3|nr:hypothetical protein [Helicobacter sp.]MDE7174598.1 hypothetical protein [Helicobacter sp.]